MVARAFVRWRLEFPLRSRPLVWTPGNFHSGTSALACPDADGSASVPPVLKIEARLPEAPAPGRPDTPAPTRFHQRLLAEALSLRRSGADLDRVTPALSGAQVDLNPHQLEAAAFALESLPSGGCVLADEVGLGKTVEAGIVIAQLLAEGKGRILVLAPAPLRAQWRDELWDKFGITAACLDGPSARALGRVNPFDAAVPVIASVPFAVNRAHEVARVPWDLVVIDEAHRLRNAYRPGHKSGRAMRDALAGRPKLLLTATPLQNDLFELFGLASLLDETILGTEDAFRALYAPLLCPPPPPGAPDEKEKAADREEALKDLKERLSPVIQRTLRRQVREYVRYTARRSIVEDFRPSAAESELYERVSEYLRREDVAAIEPARRTLLTLCYRKILGSSTFAIAATLSKLADALEAKVGNAEKLFVEQEKHLGDVDDGLEDEVRRLYEEEAEELLDGGSSRRRPRTLADVKSELNELREMVDLARSITVNAKGEALVRALARVFTVARAHRWPEKAVIFTESRRTQTYLQELLSKAGYSISILCGDGSGPEERKELVETFRDRTQVLISTEAGAEGLNLQFCNLVVNYDLPWNPQRIEQRIGRCHRYGQTRDVLVINFVNRANAAEARLYDLLEQKLTLFDGVFGASDEVLGSLGSGVDFERRVLDIYQTCRGESEIEQAFQKLRGELGGRIDDRMKEARTLLLERFDDSVRARLKMAGTKAKEAIRKKEEDARRLTVSVLGDRAAASGDLLHVRDLPPEVRELAAGEIAPGLYSFGDAQEARARGARKVGPASELVKAAARAVKARAADGVTFLALDAGQVPPELASLAGREGWWFAYRFEVGGADPDERLAHVVLVREPGGYRALELETSALLPEVPARETPLRPGGGGTGSSVSAAQDAAVERAQAQIKAGLDGRRAAQVDRARERWDRFTEEALAAPRRRVEDARARWEAARKAVLAAKDGAETGSLRRARDAAEREYHRGLEQLRLEEQRRYADKERALAEVLRKAGLGEIRRQLIGSAYWFMR